MAELTKKDASIFPTIIEAKRHNEPMYLSETTDDDNKAQKMHQTKSHSPLGKDIRNFDAGDSADSVSGTFECSSPSRSGLTTPDTEVDGASTDTSERKVISRLIGNSPRSKLVEKPTLSFSPRTTPSPESSRVEDSKPNACNINGKPLMSNCSGKTICGKPPPAPNVLLGTPKKSFLPEMATPSALFASSNWGQRPKSCVKSVTFNTHHEVIPPPLSKSSSLTNIHLPNLHVHNFRNNSEGYTSKTHETDSDNEKYYVDTTKRHDFINSKTDINRNIVNKKDVLSSKGFRDFNDDNSQNSDLNLNKQVDAFPKVKVLEDFIEEQHLGNAMQGNFIDNEQRLVHGFGHSVEKYHNGSLKPLFQNESASKRNRQQMKEAQSNQEQNKLKDEELTGESAKASCKTETHSSKETAEDCGDDDESSWGPNCPHASTTNLAALPDVQPRGIPDFSEYSQNPMHLPGSLYNYYYTDEMSFTPHREPMPYQGGIRCINRRAKCLHFRPPKRVRPPRIALQPHRSVLVFQPQRGMDRSCEALGVFQTATQPMQWSGAYQSDFELDDRYFPSYHNLSSSADLNREMKRVMRFHNCRNMPNMASESIEDQLRNPAHVFFNSHGWFPQSTTGMMKAKYRDTIANIQRQWYHQWYQEVTTRNIVKGPRKPRLYEREVVPRPPSIPLPTQRTYEPTNTPRFEGQSFEESTHDENDRVSPKGPVATPHPGSARPMAEVMSGTSDGRKTAFLEIRPLSSDSTSWPIPPSSPAAHWIHSEMRSSHFDEADDTRQRPGSSIVSTENILRQQHQIQNQRNFHEYEMVKGSESQAGDYGQQASMYCSATSHTSSTEPGHRDSLHANTDDTSKPSRGSSGSSSNLKYASTTTPPDFERGGDTLESTLGTKEFYSKDEENKTSQTRRNRGRYRGKKPNNNVPKGPTISWEITHLDHMLYKTQEDIERTTM